MKKELRFVKSGMKMYYKNTLRCLFRCGLLDTLSRSGPVDKGGYMGAWNYGVFDDDTAYDALIDLKGSSDIIADMEQYFDEVIQAEYIGYDEAHYALVSAAVIDSVINSFVYRCDEEDYFEWTSSQKCFDFSPLKQKAVTAIGAILSDNSELRELWEENEELYEAWKEDKLSMQKRLQQ